MSTKDGFRRAIERALGRIVDRAFPDPDTRALLGGRHVAIHLLNPKTDLYLSLGHLGLGFEPPPASPPDLSLTGSIADFRALARGENPPGLKISGDLGWIRTVGALAETLPRGRAERVTLLLGEEPAAWVNPGLDRAFYLAHLFAGSLGLGIAQALTTAGTGVDRRQARRLDETIESLSRQVSDLETRLSALDDRDPA